METNKIQNECPKELFGDAMIARLQSDPNWTPPPMFPQHNTQKGHGGGVNGGSASYTPQGQGQIAMASSSNMYVKPSSLQSTSLQAMASLTSPPQFDQHVPHSHPHSQFNHPSNQPQMFPQMHLQPLQQLHPQSHALVNAQSQTLAQSQSPSMPPYGLHIANNLSVNNQQAWNSARNSFISDGQLVPLSPDSVIVPHLSASGVVNSNQHLLQPHLHSLSQSQPQVSRRLPMAQLQPTSDIYSSTSQVLSNAQSSGDQKLTHAKPQAFNDTITATNVPGKVASVKSTSVYDDLLISAANQISQIKLGILPPEPVQVCVIEKWEAIWDPVANRMYYVDAEDEGISTSNDEDDPHDGSGIISYDIGNKSLADKNSSTNVSKEENASASWQPHESISTVACYLEERLRDLLSNDDPSKPRQSLHQSPQASGSLERQGSGLSNVNDNGQFNLPVHQTVHNSMIMTTPFQQQQQPHQQQYLATQNFHANNSNLATSSTNSDVLALNLYQLQIMQQYQLIQQQLHQLQSQQMPGQQSSLSTIPIIHFPNQQTDTNVIIPSSQYVNFGRDFGSGISQGQMSQLSQTQIISAPIMSGVSLEAVNSKSHLPPQQIVTAPQNLVHNHHRNMGEIGSDDQDLRHSISFSSASTVPSIPCSTQVSTSSTLVSLPSTIESSRSQADSPPVGVRSSLQLKNDRNESETPLGAPRSILRKTNEVDSETVPKTGTNDKRVQGFSSFSEQLCEDTRKSVGSRAGVGNGDMLLSEVDFFQRMNPVEHEAYVLKRGNGILKRWKMRWMRIKEGRLAYWENHDDCELLLPPIRDVSVIGASFYPCLPSGVSPPKHGRARMVSDLRMHQNEVDLAPAMKRAVSVEEVKRLRKMAIEAGFRTRKAVTELEQLEKYLTAAMKRKALIRQKLALSKSSQETQGEDDDDSSTDSEKEEYDVADVDQTVGKGGRSRRSEREKARLSRRKSRQQNYRVVVASRSVSGRPESNDQDKDLDVSVEGVQSLDEKIRELVSAVQKARGIVRNARINADSADRRVKAAEAVVKDEPVSTGFAMNDTFGDQVEMVPEGESLAYAYIVTGSGSNSTPFALAFENSDDRDYWLSMLQLNGAVNACLPISRTESFRIEGGDGAPPATLYGDRIEIHVRDDCVRTIPLTPRSIVQPKGTKSLRLVVAACPERRVASSYFAFRLRTNETTLSWFKLIREVLASQQGEIFGSTFEWATIRSPVCIPLPLRDSSAWLLANGKGVPDLWLQCRTQESMKSIEDVYRLVAKTYNESKYAQVPELFQYPGIVAYVLKKFVSSSPDTFIPSHLYDYMSEVRLETISTDRLFEISFLQRQRLRRARNANRLSGYSANSVGAAVADPNMFLPARGAETRVIHSLRKVILRLSDANLLCLSQFVYTLKELYTFWHDTDARRYRIGYNQRRTDRRIKRLMKRMKAQHVSREIFQTSSSSVSSRSSLSSTSSRSSRVKSESSIDCSTTSPSPSPSPTPSRSTAESTSSQITAAIERKARSMVLRAESRERRRKRKVRLERRRKLTRQVARAERRILLLQTKTAELNVHELDEGSNSTDGQSEERPVASERPDSDSEASTSTIGSSCWDNSEFDDDSDRSIIEQFTEVADDKNDFVDDSLDTCDPRMLKPWPNHGRFPRQNIEIDVENSDDEMDDECDERDDEFLSSLDSKLAEKYGVSNDADDDENDENEGEYYAQAFNESRRELQNMLINFSGCIIREPLSLETPHWTSRGQREALNTARADAILRTLILQYDVIFPLGPPFPF